MFCHSKMLYLFICLDHIFRAFFRLNLNRKWPENVFLNRFITIVNIPGLRSDFLTSHYHKNSPSSRLHIVYKLSHEWARIFQNFWFLFLLIILNPQVVGIWNFKWSSLNNSKLAKLCENESWLWNGLLKITSQRKNSYRAN